MGYESGILPIMLDSEIIGAIMGKTELPFYDTQGKNPLTEKNRLDTVPDTKDGFTRMFLEQRYGMYDLSRKDPSNVNADPSNLNGIEVVDQNKQNNNYNHQSLYARYEKEEKEHKKKEGTKKEYSPVEDNKKAGDVYTKSNGNPNQASAQEDYVSSLFREDSEVSRSAGNYSALELKAYGAVVQEHAYQGLLKGNRDVQNYLAANTLYSISASEGYMEALGTSYFNVDVHDNKGEYVGGYSLIFRDKGGRNVKYNAEVIRQLEEVLASVGTSDEKAKGIILDNLIKKLFESDEKFKFKLSMTELEETKEMMQKIRMDTGDRITLMVKGMKQTVKGKRLEFILSKENLKDGKVIDVKDLNDENKLKNKQIEFRSGDYGKDNKNKQIGYLNPLVGYNAQRAKKMGDFTNNVPLKSVTKFPVSTMGGTLGFTYLGENFMGIRDDLYGDEAHEVEVHEAIHTHDEYETRVITKWMLDNEVHFH